MPPAPPASARPRPAVAPQRAQVQRPGCPAPLTLTAPSPVLPGSPCAPSPCHVSCHSGSVPPRPAGFSSQRHSGSRQEGAELPPGVLLPATIWGCCRIVAKSVSLKMNPNPSRCGRISSTACSPQCPRWVPALLSRPRKLLPCRYCQVFSGICVGNPRLCCCSGRRRGQARAQKQPALQQPAARLPDSSVLLEVGTVPAEADQDQRAALSAPAPASAARARPLPAAVLVTQAVPGVPGHIPRLLCLLLPRCSWEAPTPICCCAGTKQQAGSKAEDEDESFYLGKSGVTQRSKLRNVKEKDLLWNFS